MKILNTIGPQSVIFETTDGKYEVWKLKNGDYQILKWDDFIREFDSYGVNRMLDEDKQVLLDAADKIFKRVCE